MNMRFIAVFFSLFALSIPLHVHAVTASPGEQQVTQKESTHPKINLNTADLSTLVGSFKGIGTKRAEAIIAYRESHHGFKSIDELAEVKGLGTRFVSANRDKLNETYIIK